MKLYLYMFKIKGLSRVDGMLLLWNIYPGSVGLHWRNLTLKAKIANQNQMKRVLYVLLLLCVEKHRAAAWWVWHDSAVVLMLLWLLCCLNSYWRPIHTFCLPSVYRSILTLWMRTCFYSYYNWRYKDLFHTCEKTSYFVCCIWLNNIKNLKVVLIHKNNVRDVEINITYLKCIETSD